LYEQNNEILKLNEIVAGLTNLIKHLEAKLDNNHVQSNSVQRTEAAPIPVAAKLPSQTTRAQPTVSNVNATERKFKIVAYGIKESPQNTNRQERMKHDLDCVLTYFTF